MNSLYSFWWDVSNDWGLDLLKPHSVEDARERTPAPRRLILPHLHSGSPLLSSSISESARNGSGEPGGSQRRSYPYGLRPTLLYPLPVYPLLVFLNLVLRWTWSIKLSSHLHSQTESSVAIFWLEVAEIVRRWMWVFIRVEWELIKKGREGPGVQLNEYSGDEADYEMIPAPPENDPLPDA